MTEENKQEEQLMGPQQPVNEDKTIPGKIINDTSPSQKDSMEVHHHTHAEHKKFKHYLWEFFMLFLAVFCGFLAEYQLEHTIEKDREKELMHFLLEDLKEDTSEINKSLSQAKLVIQYEDSLMYYIYQHPSPEFLPDHYFTFDLYALLRLKIIFNEATAPQLKNAGNLRLVRKQNVARQISLYWNQQERTKIDLDRYLEYRNRAREFEENMFSFYEGDLVEAGLIPPDPRGVKTMLPIPAVWKNYANIISHCHITLKGYIDELNNSYTQAKKLIDLLNQEYHLKQ